jgi:uncharacterized membrane protein
MSEISDKRLFLGISAIFFLGILFSLVSGEYAVQTGESMPYEVYLIAGASMLVGAFIVLLFQTRRRKNETERILKILPHDEQTVVRILLQNKGRIEQNYLVVLSGFNKVKISRLVGGLEARGVLEKKKLGNTNYLILKV